MILLKNATIVTSLKEAVGSILIEGGKTIYISIVRMQRKYMTLPVCSSWLVE